MPTYVAEDSIDMRVVKDWSRIMAETATDRGDQLSVVQPFFPFQQTYAEVIEAINTKSHQGLKYYHYMVGQLPWYDFEKK